MEVLKVKIINNTLMLHNQPFKVIVRYVPAALLLIFCLLAGEAGRVWGQGLAQNTGQVQADSVQERGVTNTAGTADDFAPGLLFMFVIFVVVCIGMTGTGVVLSICVLFFLFLLISVGVVSVSVAGGLYKRSFMAGFRIFILVAMGVLGTLGGISGVILANYLFVWHISYGIGAAGGLAGGLLLGLLVNGIIRIAMRLIQGRLSIE